MIRILFFRYETEKFFFRFVVCTIRNPMKGILIHYALEKKKSKFFVRYLVFLDESLITVITSVVVAVAEVVVAVVNVILRHHSQKSQVKSVLTADYLQNDR